MSISMSIGEFCRDLVLGTLGKTSCVERASSPLERRRASLCQRRFLTDSGAESFGI